MLSRRLETTVFKLWAKTDPFHPLVCHLIDAGSVAMVLLQTSAFRSIVPKFCEAAGCSPDQARCWLAYLVACHDLGKCRSDFQGKGPPDLVAPLESDGLCCIVEDPKYRHEAMSGQWAMNHLIDAVGWDRPSAHTVAAALRGHHGDFRVDDPTNEVASLKAQWEPLRSELEAVLRQVFAPSSWEARFRDHSAAGILLSGLIVFSDWIASNPELFPFKDGDIGFASYVALSGQRAENAVASLGLTKDVPWSAPMRFGAVWPEIRNPRPVQSACEELCGENLKPGLAIVEAPMGEGKTEAAIYLATQWMRPAAAGGIYVALPTAATSNQMYGRFKAFLAAHDPPAAHGVRLVHGMAWLLDEASPQCPPELSSGSGQEQTSALEWFRPKKRSLLASNGVGTIDQALMSVLHVKHGFLRLFGLAGKVLVIDEVHAYDAYMSEILTLLLRWCRDLQIPVVLLSATLPQSRRKALIEAYAPGAALNPARDGETAPYPLLTYVGWGGEVREKAVTGSAKTQNVRLVKHPGLLGDPTGLARLVADQARDGGCLCVIANTVDSAQAIYRELQAIFADFPQPPRLLLFHARFRAGRRQEIEEEALRLFDKRSLLDPGDAERTERPGRAVLIATQVVEQSLDLDFDEMFTEFAPVDLLLQRVGRLHRHLRPSRPTGPEARLHLLLPGPGRPVFGATERVYHRFVLLKTLLALAGVEELNLPEDIRPLVEAVYDDSPTVKGEDTIASEDLAAAWEDLRTQVEREKDEAKKYLIPPPYEAAFKLARMPGGPFDDEDGEASSYFTAKTRVGDETRQLLLLEGEAFRTELTASRPPGRDTLKRIFFETVNVPKWWLRDVEADCGFEPPKEAPAWLPGVTVLRLHGGFWRGRERQGKTFSVRDDPDLGVVREETERA